MKYFNEFPEERQLAIVQQYGKEIRQRFFLKESERIEERINNNLKEFVEKWGCGMMNIEYELPETDEIIYVMNNFRWKGTHIVNELLQHAVSTGRWAIKQEIEWLEKVGGVEYYIDVGMHMNTLELNSSHRIYLTDVLTLDERALRIMLMKQELEEDEETMKKIKCIEDTGTTSKERKKKDKELDRILKDLFAEKRKLWKNKIEETIEKEFEELKKDNQKIVDYYSSDEYVMGRLVKENLLYFTDAGVPKWDNG